MVSENEEKGTNEYLSFSFKSQIKRIKNQTDHPLVNVQEKCDVYFRYTKATLCIIDYSLPLVKDITHIVYLYSRSIRCDCQLNGNKSYRFNMDEFFSYLYFDIDAIFFSFNTGQTFLSVYILSRFALTQIKVTSCRIYRAMMRILKFRTTYLYFTQLVSNDFISCLVASQWFGYHYVEIAKRIFKSKQNDDKWKNNEKSLILNLHKSVSKNNLQ